MTKRTTRSKSTSRSTSSRRTTRSRAKPREPLFELHLTRDQKLDLVGLSLVFTALLTILSLLSSEQGRLPAMWLSALSRFFGWGMIAVPVFIGGLGLWLILRRFGDRIPQPAPEQVLGILMGFVVTLATMHFVATLVWPQSGAYAMAEEGLGGGLLGALLWDLGQRGLGRTGLGIALAMLWIVVLSFTAGLSPVEAVQLLFSPRSEPRPTITSRSPARGTAEPVALGQVPLPSPPPAPTDTPAASPRSAKRGRATEPEIKIAGRANQNGDSELHIALPATASQTWRLPTLTDILEQGSEQDYSENLIRKQARIIEETLASLGAPSKVMEINQGPVVTQFGVEPLFLPARNGKTTKVKVSKISALADDLALALSAQRLRIEAPIPGKGLVGIEVPNIEPSVVALRDVMESEGFHKLKGTLRLGLGQDVSGQAACADMRAMPHLLIAGTTGSGKSVCVNGIIAALLLQNSPDTLRLLMVDPKRVELTQYAGIPHLLAPVIVEVDRVVPALRWVMREMDSRYRRFAQIGSRNIEDFNQRALKAQEETLPYIVLIVDELADLMLQSPEETERGLCRLAQMARATGIHLIIATQRPSVDVVTGLIKANFPARIAFAVASSVDSRVILDTPGAERLLGRGDMLFMPPDAGMPMRLQGAFVSDDELNRLIMHWRLAIEPSGLTPNGMLAPQPEPGLVQTLVQPPLFPELEEPAAGHGFEDELLPTAVEIILAENRGSISLLQRRLRIGYTRAARLVDLMTDMGVVTASTEAGQAKSVNRAVAEAFLRSLSAGDGVAA